MDKEGPEKCEPIASEFERVREKAAGLVNQMLGEGVVKAKREAGHFAFSISTVRAKMLSWCLFWTSYPAAVAVLHHPDRVSWMVCRNP